MKPSKIADELIGMLNADGGVLAFVIDDQGDFQDISKLGNLNKYRSIALDYIEPSANITLEEITLKTGELIFIYHVEQDCERCFSRKDNDSVFLRVNDENRQLNRDQVRHLEYDKQIRKYEDEIADDFDLNDVDNNVLDLYIEKMNYQGTGLDLLVNRHIAQRKSNQYFLKKSAILLFSKNPEKYIPSASVRYVRYEGISQQSGDKYNVIKDERFEENIPTLIEKLKGFLKITFKDYYFLDIEVGKFKKVSEYPEEAWLEGIANALCHRSYNQQGNVVCIKHFDDRLEISNSGPLPAQVTIENIRKERYSRNPRIARVLEDLGYVRQLNEGVSRIYESMEKSMLSVPKYVEQNGNVYLILRNKIARNDKAIDTITMQKIELDWPDLNETQRRIIIFLFQNYKGRISEFSQYTSVSEQMIRQYLNNFCKYNLLERNSEKKRDKNAFYTFKRTKQ